MIKVGFIGFAADVCIAGRIMSIRVSMTDGQDATADNKRISR